MPRKIGLKKRGRGTHDTDKAPVLITVHRKSKYTTFNVEKNLSKDLISKKIEKFIDNEAILYTDEYSIYSEINEHDKIKNHVTVSHSKKEYIMGKIIVNTCKNKYSLLKLFLKIFGVVSKKF